MTDYKEIRKIPITDVARMLGYTPVRIGHYYTLKEHDSVRINPDKNIFFRNSTGERGSCIDFVMAFCCRDFKDAVKLLEESGIDPSITYKETKKLEKAKERPELQLPERDHGMRNVFAYLIKTRCLSPEIVHEMVDRGMLYQDVHKNCVFVGRNEENLPCYGMIRGTNTYKKFVADCKGSDYERCFFVKNRDAKNLIVTEGVIDALSLMTISINWRESDYLAVGGTGKAERAIWHYLSEGGYEKVLIGFDNDEAGLKAATAMRTMIREEYPEIATYILTPKEGKDFNEQLQISAERTRSMERIREKETEVEL